MGRSKIAWARPRLGEPIWSFCKDGHRFDCELRPRGVDGIEVQLYRNREFYASRMFPTRALALAWAEAERHEMRTD